MFRRNLMSRREVLKSALGGLMLAPLLRGRELQAQNVNPKRIVLLFTPDSNPPEWWPEVGGGEFGFTLGEPLADFAGLEQHLTFIRRLDHSWTYDNHHVAGIVQLFTGARWVQQGQNEFANGPSFDQLLLQETDLRGGTPRASVHLGVDDGRTDARHIIAYAGPNQPLAGEINPTRAYDDIFDGVSFGQPSAPAAAAETDPGADALAAANRRLIEVNMDEVRGIQNYLGQDERMKLEAHLEALNELQMRIQASEVGNGQGAAALVGGSCEELSTRQFGSRDLTNETAITEWAQLQSDIIVNAFTCDRARVASLNYSFSGGHHEGLMGFNGSWHDDVAHQSYSGGQPRQNFIRFSRFWGGHLAYLVRRLSEISEGDGSMLDNTLLVWGVESGTDHSHSPVDMQYLLMGGRGIGFNTGQFLQLDGTQSAHKLHTTILNAFGLEANGFGIEPDSGTLAGLVG